MLSLDEAIKHCEDKAQELSCKVGCEECAREHLQLRDWLSELKRLRQQDADGNAS